jgi:hypothetical protein
VLAVSLYRDVPHFETAGEKLRTLHADCDSTICFSFKDWWDSKLPETGIFSWLSVIPKVLLAGAITLMDELYQKLAVWLNDKGL